MVAKGYWEAASKRLGAAFVMICLDGGNGKMEKGLTTQLYCDRVYMNSIGVEEVLRWKHQRFLKVSTAFV